MITTKGSDPVTVLPPAKKSEKKKEDPPAKNSGQHFKGDTLVPAWDGEIAGRAQEHFYWVGVLPSCPVDSMAIAGVMFPKANGLQVADPAQGGRKRLVPVFGSIVPLTTAKVKLLLERLPRTVVRRTGEIKIDPSTGEKSSKGHLVQIPTKETLEERAKRGKPINPYVQRPTDEPAARYLYAQICDDQDDPARGRSFESLEEAGLEWPEPLE